MPKRNASIRWLVTFTILAGVSLLPGAAGTAADPPRPNIIFIMSDDMGWSDLGCYGGEIATPTLDSLAGDGVRFTQFYNTGRCCPTRASLLTGLYAHQAGIGHMMNDRGLDGYRGDLNRHCVTVAEVLRNAGYRTYMSGKWHVTKTVNPQDSAGKHNWPLQRGFDRFYGTITAINPSLCTSHSPRRTGRCTPSRPISISIAGNTMPATTRSVPRG